MHIALWSERPANPVQLSSNLALAAGGNHLGGVLQAGFSHSGPAQHASDLLGAGAFVERADLRLRAAVVLALFNHQVLGCEGGDLRQVSDAQHLLAELLESERLVLYAGSSFDHGYELLDAAILAEPQNADDLERIDRSATKSARRTLRRIEDKGHFHA